MTTTLKLTTAIPTIDRRRAEIASGALAILERSASLSALFIHGSYTRDTSDESSDLDIIVVTPNEEQAKLAVSSLLSKSTYAASVICCAYTDQFPWFGRLCTFYFDMTPLFSIDLGIITLDELSSFFVEPDAIIVCDIEGKVAARKRHCYQSRIARRHRQFASVEFDVFHAFSKITVALRRGHLWNAIEYVNVLRRLLFSLIRETVDVPGYVHVGRAERDIESKIGEALLQDVAGTIPTYDVRSIVTAALAIYRQIRSALALAGLEGESEFLTTAIGQLMALGSIDADQTA